MLNDLKRVNPKQHALVLDPSPHVAGICPRRAGKSYAGAAAALITGEAKPGSISLIISLNLKQLRRLYWAGGPSGLFTIAKKYNLNLTFNSTYLRWEHENGSIGYLLGAEDDEQLEVILGMEADLYLIDECKSFAPAKLEKLVDVIIDPQRSSREGRLILIGTPGFIAAGPFWQATCPSARDSQKRVYAIPAGSGADALGRTPAGDLLWSCHSWTLQDNSVKPQQWRDALIKKKAKGWADDHPSWQREYLGLWTLSSEGLVFRYAAERGTGQVTWTPNRTMDNPTGLPKEGAPWRLVAGLDIGYEAPTAFELLAYSAKLKQVRSVWGFSQKHLLPPDVAEMILGAITQFGPIEKIYADMGNLGKMIVKELVMKHGLPLEKAEKREKYDHVELVNAGFVRGEVLIQEGTTLEAQLLTNAWDLEGGTKEELARLEKLVEDPAIPNDSTDAFLYAFRGCMHGFGLAFAEEEPEFMSPAWVLRMEKAALARYRADLLQRDNRLGDHTQRRAPDFVRAALKGTAWIPSTPTNYRFS